MRTLCDLACYNPRDDSMAALKWDAVVHLLTQLVGVPMLSLSVTIVAASGGVGGQGVLCRTGCPSESDAELSSTGKIPITSEHRSDVAKSGRLLLQPAWTVHPAGAALSARFKNYKSLSSRPDYRARTLWQSDVRSFLADDAGLPMNYFE